MLAFDLVYRFAWNPGDRMRPLSTHLWQLFREGYVALVPAFLAVAVIRAGVYRDVRVRATALSREPARRRRRGDARADRAQGRRTVPGALAWPVHLRATIPTMPSPRSFAAAKLGRLASLRRARRFRGTRVRRGSRTAAESPLAFFILFSLLTLVPTSNALLVIGTIMGERLAYLPLVGFAGSLAVGLTASCRRMTQGGWIPSAVGRVLPGYC